MHTNSVRISSAVRRTFAYRRALGGQTLASSEPMDQGSRGATRQEENDRRVREQAHANRLGRTRSRSRCVACESCGEFGVAVCEGALPRSLRSSTFSCPIESRPGLPRRIELQRIRVVACEGARARSLMSSTFLVQSQEKVEPKERLVGVTGFEPAT